jgi:hypothetical protein
VIDVVAAVVALAIVSRPADIIGSRQAGDSR